jgi:hypothetical protein
MIITGCIKGIEVWGVALESERDGLTLTSSLPCKCLFTGPSKQGAAEDAVAFVSVLGLRRFTP